VTALLPLVVASPDSSDIDQTLGLAFVYRPIPAAGADGMVTRYALGTEVGAWNPELFAGGVFAVPWDHAAMPASPPEGAHVRTPDAMVHPPS
jgi:hypothetical protein